MNRRDFLRRAAVLGASTVLPVGLDGWAARFAAAAEDDRRVVVVFLRGAVDGLSVVVPWFEAAYADLRPRIALPRPGQPGGVLDLDGRFGLHPALAPLLPLWKAGGLAIVHASGSPDPGRSHFDAQAYMETATPGIKATRDGWMNRLLGVLPGGHRATEAVALGETVPLALAGRYPVANVPLGREAAKVLPVDRPRVNAAFARLYGGKDALSVAFREGQTAREQLLADLDDLDVERKAADAGAPSPVGFARDAEQLARLIAIDPSIRLAFLAVGGWDTHVNQGSTTGQLARHLAPLADGLAALARGLGPAWARTVVLVCSEFGRTVKENGDGGTDHGHGNALFALGGPVQGGRVLGTWPGLAEADRFQGRDLAVTTDFREAIASVLTGHLGLGPAALAAVLPGYAPTGSLRDLIRT